MDVNALWAGLLRAMSGAVAYGSIVVRRERWRGVAVVAIGMGLLINLVTMGNRSPAWHTARFWVACVILAVSVAGFAVDFTARRSSRSRKLGSRA